MIDIDRKFWRKDTPGEIYQVIIEVDSEIHGTRAQPLKATFVFLAVIQQYENLKIYWQKRVHSIHHIIHVIGKF